MVFEENFFSEHLINESMNLTPIPMMHLWSPVKSMDSNWEPTIPLPGGHHDGDFGQNCVFDVDCGFRVFGVHMMVMVLTRQVIMMLWRKKAANWHLPKTMCWQFDDPLLAKSCQHYGEPVHLKQGSDTFPHTAEASKAPEGGDGEGGVRVGEGRQERSEGGDSPEPTNSWHKLLPSSADDE